MHVLPFHCRTRCFLASPVTSTGSEYSQGLPASTLWEGIRLVGLKLARTRSSHLACRHGGTRRLLESLLEAIGRGISSVLEYWKRKDARKEPWAAAQICPGNHQNTSNTPTPTVNRCLWKSLLEAKIWTSSRFAVECGVFGLPRFNQNLVRGCQR